MNKYSHISVRYIFNRIKVLIDEKINPENPWLTAEAVFLLDRLLRPTDIGVEFGSGRSTIWFAKRLRWLTSFEDNESWFIRVQKMLEANKLTHKVSYKIIEAGQDYSEQASIFSNNSIDFCLVDSLDRGKCALGMLEKIKPGGVLVIDNINWFLPNNDSYSPNSRRSRDGTANEDWDLFNSLTNQWRQIWTSNGVSDTCIYFKP